MTSQFMTSRSIVALLTETELSRFAHSASDPLGEGAAGAGASAVEEERRAAMPPGRRGGEPRIWYVPLIEEMGWWGRTVH